MGTSVISKVNFEDIQNARQNHAIIINTLPHDMQSCLILNTINAYDEERILNEYLNKNKMICIYVYGKNSNDETIQIKYTQLKKLGFKNVYLYIGGLFEWLLLQDIYGNDEFQTTNNELDILKYKPISTQSNSVIIYR